MLNNVKLYLKKTTSSSSLSFFRFLFGLIMFISIIRFFLKGWIYDFYINPDFQFTYYGFEWVSTLGNFTYLLFFICSLSALFVCIGYRYRISIIIFFLSFTYIELMDKTYYLNHYYFVSILSFLLIFLPANASFSIDSVLSKKRYKTVPKWTVDCIKILLSIVYIYAGIAKINSDWLINAQPIQIWMQSKFDFTFLNINFGETLFQKKWFYYFMSWAGMIYDISIPLLLFFSRTRTTAFFLVVVFHLLTVVLFPIGMFPYIMITSSLIFFSARFHDNIVSKISSILYLINNKINFLKQNILIKEIKEYNIIYKKPTMFIIMVFFVIQLLFPFRYLFYPGELFWHEQGYRFSWRVMLMDKVGNASFKIHNPNNNNEKVIESNLFFLTDYQEKQMSFQPDMILEYAHFLGDYYKNTDINNDGVIDFDDDIHVYADVFVSLNGRINQRLINPKFNLYSEKESFKNKKWILPCNYDIKGF